MLSTTAARDLIVAHELYWCSIADANGRIRYLSLERDITLTGDDGASTTIDGLRHGHVARVMLLLSKATIDLPGDGHRALSWP
jgi:hypothetical protein